MILPLSKPALITLGLFTFMGSWNMFEWPLVVLSNQDYYPLTVGLLFSRRDQFRLAAHLRRQRHGRRTADRALSTGPALPGRRHQPERNEDLIPDVGRTFGIIGHNYRHRSQTCTK